MAVPFIVFWMLVYVAREDLGLKGVGICVTLWAALLAGCMFLRISPYVFVAMQALVDAILIIIVFGGDIRIR